MAGFGRSPRAPASEPATGWSARRPRIAWERAVEPRRHQGRRVCSIAVQRWKIDPSRGTGRGRRAAGRDGRDGPRDCAGAAPWRPVATGAARPRGTAACSRRGRGRTPRRRRTNGCSVGRSSGVAAGPRRRSARVKLRLDSAVPTVAQQRRPARSVGARGGHEGPALIPGPHPTLEVRFNATRLQCNLTSPKVVPDSLRSRAPTDDPSGRRHRLHRRRLVDGAEDSRAAERQRPSGRGPRARERRLQARLAQLPTPLVPTVAACARRAFRGTRVVARRNALSLRHRRPHRPAQPGRSVSRGYPRPGMTNTDVRLGTHRPQTDLAPLGLSENRPEPTRVHFPSDLSDR